MATFDADARSVRFEADGRLTVELAARLVDGESCQLRAVHLARATPDARGDVVMLATIDALGVTLAKDREWQGSITWSLGASKIARELGSVIAILAPDDGKPVGIGFELHAAAVAAKHATTKRARFAWVLLVLVLIGVALAVGFRECHP